MRKKIAILLVNYIKKGLEEELKNIKPTEEIYERLEKAFIKNINRKKSDNRHIEDVIQMKFDLRKIKRKYSNIGIYGKEDE